MIGKSAAELELSSISSAGQFAANSVVGDNVIYGYNSGGRIIMCPGGASTPALTISPANTASTGYTSGTLAVIGGVGVQGSVNVSGSVTAPTFVGALTGAASTMNIRNVSLSRTSTGSSANFSEGIQLYQISGLTANSNYFVSFTMTLHRTTPTAQDSFIIGLSNTISTITNQYQVINIPSINSSVAYVTVNVQGFCQSNAVGNLFINLTNNNSTIVSAMSFQNPYILVWPAVVTTS